MERYRQMMIFDAVANAPSLAAAARQLRVSQATVSRALAALEARLGQSLLNRTTQGVSLTPVGRAFAVDCARILGMAEQADAAVNGLHVEPGGLLRLVSPLLFGDHLLMPLVFEYLQAWPGVQISVNYQDAFPDLHEQGVDIAVSIGALPEGYLVARKVGEVGQMICASPDYLARHPAPDTPADLSEHALVFCSADSRIPQWRFQPDTSRSYRLKPTLRCTTESAALKAAVDGAGLACCPSYQVHEHVRAGTLDVVLQGFAPPPVPVHLVYREGPRASAAVRSFVDFVSMRLRLDPVLNHCQAALGESG